jgi:hypothetical protein
MIAATAEQSHQSTFEVTRTWVWDNRIDLRFGFGFGFRFKANVSE